MKKFEERLVKLEEHVNNNEIRIMIIGLGSVGTYLLDYIVSRNDPAIKVIVVGRDYEKLEMKTNIVRISALIREQNKSQIEIAAGVDLNDINVIADCIAKYQPDFIVNSSRAYPGLKYGSISWKNLRAYGIWTPLAIKYTKNIMEACDKADTNAIVINTSYSDAVIPWLKSAGKPYPDFGSGNFNHLVPRIKYAVAETLGVKDFWNVDVMFASAHFHDVCISKEGHNENTKQILKIYYEEKEVNLPQEKVFELCKIPMPVDATRNMMNASSNYRIIFAIIDAIRNHQEQKIFTPGVFGEIGGYPVRIGYDADQLIVKIDDTVFSLEDMKRANRQSIALDGIENIENGKLIYTDALIQKCQEAFQVTLPKKVDYEEIDDVAAFIIQEIIQPQLEK